MGIIETLQEENRQLRRDFEEFLAYVTDYIESIDDEIKGYTAASKYTGVSARQLRRLVEAGSLPFKKHGRSVSFSRKDLIEYKHSRRLVKV
ncbi:helix-turn-helix domain-containing protein [Pontibacter liquoris]|uniref:helix-turn-helix domain-containing protein n=1 Tax=Pontibacter liquoris TaxID=2905677 RepID=UPI001FA7B83C|nr:helix-turn-helix domain-containing protein [Pontibacter liquoris]